MSVSFFTSLRFRFLLLILTAVLPILGLTLYRNFELRHLALENVRQESLRLARLAANDQQDSIRDTRQLLFALAQLPEVRSTDPGNCSTFFAQLLKQYPQYAFLGVVSANGEIFCSAYPPSGPANISNQAYFQRVLQTRDFAMSDYQRDPISGKALLSFGYPVIDNDGAVEAVIVAALNLDWLNQLASDLQLPAGTVFTVIDRSGTILVRYPDPQGQVGQALSQAPLLQTILEEADEGVTELVDADGVTRLYAVTPLSGLAGERQVYVTIGAPTDLAFADANQALTRNLIGLGAVTVLALSAAWVGSQFFILRRVTDLVKVTRRLSAGDLSARTGLSYGRGELSQLAAAFDDMAASLERRIAERDEAEASLRESQRMLSTLFSNLPGMAYRCRPDPNRPMLFVSEGCLPLTGYAPANFDDRTGMVYGNLIHPDERKRVWRQIEAAIEKERPFQLTYRLTTATGEEKWVWEQGRGVHTSKGALVALEGFITDATERVLAYHLLEQRVADRTRELLALYEVTAVASGSLDLDTILDRALDRILGVMAFEAGYVHLVDEAKKLLYLTAQRIVGSTGDRDPCNTPLIDDQLLHQAFEHSQPQLGQVRTSEPESTTDGRMQVSAPMRAGGRTLGVLSVIGAIGRNFTPEEMALLDSLADQVGVAVDNARLYQQAEQLAVMKERSRLARDLHDSVTQSLYSVMLLAEVAQRSVRAGDSSRAENYLAEVTQAVEQVLKEMRLLIYELRPLALQQEGLIGALKQRLEAVEGRAGVETRFEVEGQLDLPASIEEELYRLAQEVLNNALKHAAAKRVEIKLRAVEGRVELEIVDDGIGFVPDQIDHQGGFGLVGMKERAQRLGGKLTIESAPERGTRIMLVLQPVKVLDAAAVAPPQQQGNEV